MSHAHPGGSLTLADGLQLSRMGFGAMQLAGPGVWGMPTNREEAIAVLRTAVDLGITHIDTSDYYGPYTVNELIREALHPYPDNLRIVTKVGARRGADRSWPPALAPDELVTAVQENLDHLGLDVLDVVNLRITDPSQSLAESFATLAELQQKGLIRHLGVSTVSAVRLAEAQSIAPVVCVQNQYNIAHREDDALVDICAEQGIAYVPYFPLGGFSPLQHEVLDAVAARVDATPRQVALAWLLQRSPTILLIPGTSSVAHLRENVGAANVELSPEVVAELDGI